MAKRIDQISTVDATTGDKFIIFDASTGDVGAVAVDGYTFGRFPQWFLVNAYKSGDTVRTDKGFFTANSDIGASTAFVVGAAANQWTVVNTGAKLVNTNTGYVVFDSNNTTETVVRSPTASKGYLNVTDTMVDYYVNNRQRVKSDATDTTMYGPTGTNAGSYRTTLGDTEFAVYGNSKANARLSIYNSATIVRSPISTDANGSKLEISDAQIIARVNDKDRIILDGNSTQIKGKSSVSYITLNDTDFIFKNSATTNSGMTLADASLYPTADNYSALGRNGNRWSQLWAANTTINTSDQRLKTPLQELPVELLDSWLSTVRIGSWQWLEKDNGVHAGFIAQDVVKAFEDVGLSVDEWFSVQKDDEGLLSIAMSEILAIEAAAQRRRIDKLEALLRKEYHV